MRIAVLLLFLAFNTTFAQIVIDTTNHPHVGTTYNLTVLDTLSPHQVIPIGENIVWDYSVANIPDSIGYFGQYTFQAPSVYPQSSNFPNANLVMNNTNADSALTFYSSSSSGLFTVGDYILFKNTLEPVALFSPEGPEFKTPMSYGDTFTVKSVEHLGSDSSFRNLIKVKVDGWGTLKLPGNLTYNVLKTTQKVYAVQSVYKNNSGTYEYIKDSITPDSIIYYRWFTNNTDYPLIAQLVINYNLSPPSAYFAYFQSTTKPPVSISNLTNIISSSGSSFKVYPCPSSGAINIVTDKSGYTLKITNIMGIEFKTLYLEQEKSYIDLSSLPEGIYYLQFINNTQSQTQRLVLQK